MKGNLLGKNILYSFTGLVLSFILYCLKNNDPSMTGWYLTFAIFPIIILPSVNYLFISWCLNIDRNRLAIIVMSLIVPVITLVIYFFVPEFVILMWTLCFLIVNLWTTRKIKVNQS